MSKTVNEIKEFLIKKMYFFPKLKINMNRSEDAFSGSLGNRLKCCS